jgi:predicted nuclease with TOPRIM domain
MPNFAITKDGLEYVTQPKDSSKLKAKIEELKSKVNELKLEKARTLNSEEREAANISDEQYVEIIERLTDELDEIEPELQKLLDEVKYLSAFSPKKVLENKVIEDFIDILTSEELQENFLTPDSTDVLMSLGSEINNIYQKEKIDKADNTAKLSFNNVIKTRTNLLRFKSLVGQAALAATSHSLAQKAGLTAAQNLSSFSLAEMMEFISYQQAKRG